MQTQHLMKLCKKEPGSKAYREEPAHRLKVEEKLEVMIGESLVALLLVVTATPIKFKQETWIVEATLYFDPPHEMGIANIVMKYYKNLYLFIESFRNYATKPNSSYNPAFTPIEVAGLKSIGKRVFRMLLCIIITQWPFLLDKGEESIVFLEAASLVTHIMENNEMKLVSYYQKLGFTVVRTSEAIEGVPMANTIGHLLSVAERSI